MTLLLSQDLWRKVFQLQKDFFFEGAQYVEVHLADVVMYFTCCLLLWVVFGLGCLLLDTGLFQYKDKLKARSWILSGFTAFVLPPMGAVAFVCLIQGMTTLSGLDLTLLPIIYDNKAVYRLICVVLLAHCHMDIVIGMIFYRPMLEMLSGYVHHFIYTFIVMRSLRSPKSLLFALFAIEEIPTFVLAIGNIHTPWRMNLPFAITFFTTRIVSHGLVTLLTFIVTLLEIWNNASFRAVAFTVFKVHGSVELDMDTISQAVLAFIYGDWLSVFFTNSILLLHMHWFLNWYRKNVGVLKKVAEDGQTEAGSDSAVEEKMDDKKTQ
eukprot:Platyproteum_vivax@DN3853_c0_g1_i1.p1